MLHERPTLWSLDAEQAVLGGALISATALESVLTDLVAEDFHHEAHRKVYRAMATLAAQDPPVPADVLTVPEELQRRGLLESVGGTAYIGQLAESVPTAAHTEHYADIVRKKAIRRAAAEAGERTAREAYDEEMPCEELLQQAEARILGIAEKRQKGPGLRSARDIVLEVYDRIAAQADGREVAQSVSTGIPPLDRMMAGGMYPGDLIMLAGLTSMGKTAAAGQISANVAERGETVAFFSLEMTEEQLTHRWAAARSGVDLRRIRNAAGICPHEMARLSRALGEIGDLPIFINDQSDISVEEIRGQCRRLRRAHGLSLVVVDYLGLLRMPERESRNHQVATVTRGLHVLARELKVPVLCLAQLVRLTARREGDKRPQLSDLRDSGAIEQDADVVWFVHRPGYFTRQERGEPDPDQDEAELLVAKQRNGPKGPVKLWFYGRTQRFADRDVVREAPPERPRCADDYEA